MKPIKFIALSGPSSSGKTTIAYLLKHIFPQNVVSILHADDFCKEFEDIPTVNGYIDCDGPDAIDYERMGEVLDFMKGQEGRTPEDFESWQDEVFPGRDEASLRSVNGELIGSLRVNVEKSGFDERTRLVVVDGFLMYQNPAIREKLDVKLFFGLSHKAAKERRFSRQGYGVEAKPDEFWKTEDYFEKMVWRCYCEHHGFMFQNGNVEGQVDEKACSDAGILVKPGLDRPLEESLTWTVEQIVKDLRG